MDDNTKAFADLVYESTEFTAPAAASVPADKVDITTRKSTELFKCVPEDWLWLPKSYRICLGWITLVIFALCFLSVPISMLLALPITWRVAPYFCTSYIAMMFMSMVWPSIEWPEFRKIGQLWYEIFDFHCNLNPEVRKLLLEQSDKHQYAIGMHPHGIVPFHALLWAAYCHQYLSDEKRGMYGFGAAADVVMYIPFLRNIMGWLTGGPADYKSLKLGLTQGISGPANAARRLPRNLYILPGGIAEVFTSAPSKHCIVFKKRTGLCKLSLETGAHLVPTYVFGGTDFFHNLATGDGILSRLSRRFRAGVTIFWGQFGLPIPFSPKVTLCIADPIPVEKWKGEGPIPKEMIEALHERYLASIQELFDRYKAEAGYDGAQLEIL